MTKSCIHSVFAAILFVFCVAATGSCSDEFNAAEIGYWTFENAAAVRMEKGVLSIKGAVPVQIISPPGLDISPEKKFLWLKLRTKRDNYCVLTFGLSDGSVATKRLRMKGNRDYSEGLRDYRVYIGDIASKGMKINGVALQFTGSREIDARIGSISFYQPGYIQAAGFLLAELFEPDFIDTWTVSFVTTPTIANIPLPAVIFVLAILAVIPALVIVRLKGGNIKASAPQIALAALVIGWAVLSLRMDYNWLRIWGDEAGKLYGKNEAERIKNINNRDMDDFMDFIAFIKARVPADKKIAAGFRKKGTPLETLVAYYALPLTTSGAPDIVWVYGTNGLEFDPSSGTLSMKGERLPYRVRPYAEYGDAAALFEVIR